MTLPLKKKQSLLDNSRVLSGFVLILLFILAAQTILSMRTKSPTADEFSHHIASGYSYLLTGDFRMNPASPPLSRVLSAAPLLFLKAKAPLDHVSWAEGNCPEFSKQFFYNYNPDMDRLVFWARMPIVFLSLIFGLAVFWWGRELFGNVGGLASFILYVFCPDVIAHSGLATADLSISLFFTLSFFSFWRYLKKPDTGGIIRTGIFVGLAFLSKYSALLLPPILLLVALLAGKRKLVSFPKTTLFLAVCLFTIWAGYFFEIKPLLKNTPDPQKKAAFLEKIGGEGLVSAAQKIPIPLATFSSSIVSMGFTRAQGTNAFLMGAWSKEGWWYYYLVAFLIKNTIPFILLALLGFILIKKIGLDRHSRVTLALPVIFFFLVTLGDKAQAGIRYFLPIYPMLFLLGGGAAAYFWKKGKLFKGVVLALLLWHALEAAFIFPDALAYFNESIGGPINGHKYLRDSNIDWGQDLKGLARVVKEEGYPEVALYFNGPADPGYYKIPTRSLTEEEFRFPKNAVYAIGAHFMEFVRWTKDIKPTRVIGYSIFLYDLRGRQPLPVTKN